MWEKSFLNKSFQALMKNHSITQFATASDLKASVVERFNRMLKTRMWRYFTAQNTRHYLELLPNLLEGYNRSYHTSIKMTPAEVRPENTDQVFRNLYGTIHIRQKIKMKFKRGGFGENIQIERSV